MANWTSGILTNRGRDLQLKVEAGEKLKMTRFKLGDGMETTAEAADLNDLMGAKIAFGITGIERLGTLCKFTGVVTNTAVSAGFRAREWGLFAEDPDLGEILYMIALDDRPDYIAAQDAVLNSTITYALNVDISQASKIEPIVDPQGLVTTEILEKAAGLVRRNMEYFLNDKVFDIQLSAHPSWRLVCTKAGTTSGVLLNLHGAKLGDTYADGTAEWTVKDAYEATVDAHNKAPDAHADIRRILDDKAPIASPALTGTPTVPTASKGTSTDQIASTEFVSQAIADADAKASERALKIAILTGTVAGGETIPLPDGYTEDQCKWIVSVRTKQVDDDDTITCHTDEHRVVTCWTYQRGNKGTVNYMIIGVK